MSSSISTLFLAICFLVALPAKSFATERFVGKTVSQVVRMLGVELTQGTIITEPPAVVRGLAFRTAKGIEVSVYVKRDQVPLTFEGGDDVNLLKNLRVIGFSKYKNGKNYCVGEVPLDTQFNCSLD